MEMGFPEDVCAEALERYDGDEQLALNFLLGGWRNNAACKNKMGPGSQLSCSDTCAYHLYNIQ